MSNEELDVTLLELARIERGLAPDLTLHEVARIERAPGAHRRCPIHHFRVAVDETGRLLSLCPTCALLAARGEAELRRHPAEHGGTR